MNKLGLFLLTLLCAGLTFAGPIVEVNNLCHLKGTIKVCCGDCHEVTVMPMGNFSLTFMQSCLVPSALGMSYTVPNS